jgi:hypothetical protein
VPRTLGTKVPDDVDWKNANLAFPEYALPFLLRRVMTEDEIAALRQEARAYTAKRGKPAGKGK